MRRVKVTWGAFGDQPERDRWVRSVEFLLDSHDSDLTICERVFADTNRYEGSLWDIIQPLLPDDRTHTALSVGDRVTVDGEEYACWPTGWSKSSAPDWDWWREVED